MKTFPGWLNLPFGILVGLIAGALIYLLARQPSGQPIQLEPRPTLSPILVHVDGAVTRPGVYPLPSGSRVQQAIDSAGGYATNANTATINLAAMVEDGQKLYVPRQGETDPQPQETSGQPVELVDLNSASQELLLTLPGIGEDRARAIIAYREKNGGFKTIEELQNIEGIGQATFDKLKNLVSVAPPP